MYTCIETGDHPTTHRNGQNAMTTTLANPTTRTRRTTRHDYETFHLFTTRHIAAQDVHVRAILYNFTSSVGYRDPAGTLATW